jgi:hypothetical protein
MAEKRVFGCTTNIYIYSSMVAARLITSIEIVYKIVITSFFVSISNGKSIET